MKIPNITGFTKVVGIGKAFVMANRPELLFGASVVSTVASVVLAAKGGYEAGQKVSHEEIERITQNLSDGAMKEYEFFVQEVAPLTFQEKAALTWKSYIPAAAATVTALGSTTGLHLVHVKEKKALATAGLAALNEAREEIQAFKEKAIELIEDETKTVEEKKEELEALEADDVDWTSEVFLRDGKYLFLDDYSGRTFESNRELVRRASEVLVGEIQRHGKANLNLFYDEIGISETQMGLDSGWAREDVEGFGGSGNAEFIKFGVSELPTGESAVAIWFPIAPTTDYDVRASSSTR